MSTDRKVKLDRSGGLEHWAETQPEKVALIQDDPDGSYRELTFKQLYSEVNRVANAILALDLQPDERVAWIGRNSLEVVTLIQGAALAGLGVLPLHHSMRGSEAQELLNFGNVAVLWGEADSVTQLGDVTGHTSVRHVVVFNGEAVDGQRHIDDVLAGVANTPPVAMRQAGGHDWPIMSGFTSGTTGKPKRVLRSPTADTGSIADHFSEILGGESHTFVTSGSIASGGAGGLYSLFLGRGDCSVIAQKFNALDWIRLVETHQVTAAYCAPTNIRQICDLPTDVLEAADLSSVQCVLAGAAKWSYALKEEYRRVFPEDTLWELYGSTELGLNTVMDPTNHWDRPESCGRPVSGLEIELRDDAGTAISEPEERGVLWVRSAYASGFLGYEGDPEATSQAVDGEWRSVGDIAYFDEAGFYYICDRIKDMIISGGINIYPAEIEAVIDQHPDVLENVVIGAPDKKWGERVHAVVVCKEDANPDPNMILEHCRALLSPNKVPRSIDIVDDLPHNVAGKILKRQVRERYWTTEQRSI